MGQKDEIIEMVRLRKAGEPEPDEGEARDEKETMESIPRTQRTGRKQVPFLCGASRYQRSSNSTVQRVLSCLHQMGTCSGMGIG